MSRRERIIVGLMLVTLIVGGYIYFFSSEEQTGIQNPKMQTDALNKFVIDVVKDLTATDRTPLDNYMIANAEKPWKESPFIQKKIVAQETIPSDTDLEKDLQQEPVTDEPLPELTYSGYLRFGSETLAVINGVEYTVGEKIDSGIAVLEKITPTRIVVLYQDPNKRITLPLQEPE